MTVYVADIEVRALPGSRMEQEAAGTGGVAYAFVPARFIEDARAILQKALVEDGYEVVALELIGPYEDVSWEDAATAASYDQLAREAEERGEVVYSPFFTWD